MRSKQASPLPKPPVIPESLQDKDVISLNDYDELSEICVNNSILIGQTAKRIHIDSSKFIQVRFGGSLLEDPELTDIVFDGCDFANAEWHRTDMHRAVYNNCRMTGYHMNESEFTNVRFTGCVATMAQFRFGKLKSVWYEDCDLSGADFQGTDLTGTVFRNCKLNGACFTNAKLSKVDLRGSSIDGLIASAGQFKGVVVEQMQAISLISLLGVVIKEIDF